MKLLLIKQVPDEDPETHEWTAHEVKDELALRVRYANWQGAKQVAQQFMKEGHHPTMVLIRDFE